MPKAIWLDPVVEVEIQYRPISSGGVLRGLAYRAVRHNLLLLTTKAPTQ